MAKISLNDDSRQELITIITESFTQANLEALVRFEEFGAKLENLVAVGRPLPEIVAELVDKCEQQGRLLQFISAVKKERIQKIEFQNYAPKLQESGSFRELPYSKAEFDAIAESACRFSDPAFSPLADLAPILSAASVGHDIVRRVYRDVRKFFTTKRDPLRRMDADQLSKMHYAWSMAELGNTTEGASCLAMFAAELYKWIVDGDVQSRLAEVINATWPNQLENTLTGPPPRMQIYFDYAPGCDAKTKTQDVKFRAWTRFWTSPENQRQLVDARILHFADLESYFVEVLGNVLSEHQQHLDEMLIEFFVPFTMLGWDFESWKWEDPFDEALQLGCKYRFVVRPLLQADPKRPGSLGFVEQAIRRFNQRWNQISKLDHLVPHKTIKPPSCFCGGHQDIQQFKKDIKAAKAIGCLVIQRAYGNQEPAIADVVKPVFSEAIPIVLWARSESAAHELMETAKEMLARPPGDIPKQALDLRSGQLPIAATALPTNLTLVYEDGTYRDPTTPSTFGTVP